MGIYIVSTSLKIKIKKQFNKLSQSYMHIFFFYVFKYRQTAFL